ncbi:hypothetical protein C0Z18_29635 [Trinickia dabaoshanensis]|uniref:EfeO-type cupredoxin-like domain-containing protein n=1 Tax=Trinickia dabaoshanensis TaxID=564714 RepID=A0A2N7VCU8_9BURK|nr:cupredoxin family copper-binding protein [Trinickia dabaoshanensis]PMS14914.1 hypothetical protein C0Z18_29635 [Trinickia dabaoshanensis]
MTNRLANVWRAAARLIACAASAALLAHALPAAAAKRIIVIGNMQFHPSTVVVERGDKLVWVNRDLVPHTATAAGMFDSAAIAQGGSWSYRASTPGRYAYGCSLHPGMKAVLIVEKKRGRPASR